MRYVGAEVVLELGDDRLESLAQQMPDGLACIERGVIIPKRFEALDRAVNPRLWRRHETDIRILQPEHSVS